MPSTPRIPAEPVIIGGRRVLWERRGPQVGLVAGCFLFVAAALRMRHTIGGMVFWVTMIFFGGGGLWLLLRLLHPRNLFVAPGSPKAAEVLAALQKEKKTSPGVFMYDAGGFCIGDAAAITWQSIDLVVATTRLQHDERMTRTEIVLELHPENGALLEVSDGLAGWSRFVEVLESHVFPFPPRWLQQLEQNWSGRLLLFDRKAKPV